MATLAIAVSSFEQQLRQMGRQWPETSFANLAKGFSACAVTSKRVCTDLHATLF
jgi:hypothetical protein